jgi:hypothetical protein
VSLGIIVPTRGRPASLLRLIRAFHDTGARATVIAAVDADDPLLDDYQRLTEHPDWRTGDDLLIEPNDGLRGIVVPLNRAARAVMDRFDHLGFLGDDNVPRTPGWDTEFERVLARGTGIVYGNDLFQREKLPTAACVTIDIVKALDGMAPPTLRHLYVDNFWRALGHDLDRLVYLPDVVVEHLHPNAGKADWDPLYREVNNPVLYRADRAALAEYLASPVYQQLLDALRP